MAIIFNTKTFNRRSLSENAAEYIKSDSALNEPYLLRHTRVLPKPSVKNSVLRGGAKFSRTWVDADGQPQVAIVQISSSIPTSCPSATLTDLEADVKAAVAVNAAVADVLFRGNLNY